MKTRVVVLDCTRLYGKRSIWTVLQWLLQRYVLAAVSLYARPSHFLLRTLEGLNYTFLFVVKKNKTKRRIDKISPIILVLYIQAYVEVNQFFADKAMEAVDSLVQQNKDVLPLVWVHDYHLTLAAALIRKVKQTICQRLLYEKISFLFDRVSVLFLIFRNSFQQAAEKGIRIKLGFFLHIPFPPWDIFRLLPWANQVLEGLLGCDMVGFHIEDYCLNFLDCCQRQLDYRVDKKNFTVEHEGRKISVRPLPIGIPFDKYIV